VEGEDVEDGVVVAVTPIGSNRCLDGDLGRYRRV